MNRQQRRQAARDGRKISGPIATLTRVEDFRVPDGKIACSIDFSGLDPSTIQIDADKLTDLLAEMDLLFAGWTYQRVLSVFAAAFREWKRGNTKARDACTAVFWLALRHPASGEAMRAGVLHTLRQDGRAHITFHDGAERGIAFTLAPAFCDLGGCLEGAKAVGDVIVVERVRGAEAFSS